VTAHQLQSAHDLPGPDRVTDVDRRDDRLVGGSLDAVLDHHDAAAGHHAGESDPTVGHGQHRLADPAGQVDAAMARPVRVLRRVEGVDDVRLWVERPDPAFVTWRRP